jgi:hypothetical protein
MVPSSPNEAGVLVGPYVVVRDHEWREDRNAVLKAASRLEYPVLDLATTNPLLNEDFAVVLAGHLNRSFQVFWACHARCRA